MRQGFDTLVSETDIPTLEIKNNLSARKDPGTVSSLLESEKVKGFVIGPFITPPFPKYRINPLGIATGKYSGKKRLILDLSAPHNTGHCSVNELIDKDTCSMSYVKIDDAIKIIMHCGTGAWLCKFDISDAFKIIPLAPNQWHLFGAQWESVYYFFTRLPFGCRSSPKIFDNLSQAVCHIAKTNYRVAHILHLLDDFLTIEYPNKIGERNMAIMCTLFRRLNIPLAPHKTVGPSTCIEYLGIILDSDKMEARLPEEKLIRIRQLLRDFLKKKSHTKHQLQQILGHLNFASRVIKPGRSFVSHLITLCHSVKEQFHYIHLNKDCVSELKFWLYFLDQWNGINMFYYCEYISSDALQLFTDASATLGFGGYYREAWFSSPWPTEIPAVQDPHLSIAYKELYPIVVAAILWGHLWSRRQILFMCDNEATVFIINKGRSKVPVINQLMRRLTWLACTNNFHCYAKHVPGKLNEISDSLSRLQITRFRQLAPQAEKLPHPCPPFSEVTWT